jgi:hypothetical protein
MKLTAKNANAFASTFYVLPTQKPALKYEGACSPSHMTMLFFDANLTRQHFGQTKWQLKSRVLVTPGVPSFEGTFVQGRSSVLRMKFNAKIPTYRTPPKR